MINNMLGEAEALSITGPELMASTAPLTFDISVWQMMTPLLFGGTVRPVPDDVARGPMALFRAGRPRTLDHAAGGAQPPRRRAGRLGRR